MVNILYQGSEICETTARFNPIFKCALVLKTQAVVSQMDIFRMWLLPLVQKTNGGQQLVDFSNV